MHEIDFLFKSYLAPILWGRDGPEYRIISRYTS